MQVEGIILKSYPVREYDLVAILYTKELGKIPLSLPYANHPNKKHHIPCSSLSRVELTCQKKRGGFFSAKEIAPIDSYLKLRQSSSHFLPACEILQSLFASQLDLKPAPKLYQLAAFTLEHFLLTCNPQALVSSFRLKILRHDGLIYPNPSCSTCKNSLEQCYFNSGEFLCPQCTPNHTLSFSKNEYTILLFLAYLPSISALKDLDITDDFCKKIKTLFHILINQ